MGKISIKALVDGGKASAGPPLGPTLAQNKLNVKEVIEKINEKTKDFSGMQVPVEVVADTETKEITVKVGTPPISAMIKKELKLEKLAKTAWTLPPAKEGEAAPVEFKESIEFDKLVKIAKGKMDSLGTKDIKNAVKQVVGTCVSCGVRIDGKHPKEVLKEIKEGKYDSKIKA